MNNKAIVRTIATTTVAAGLLGGVAAAAHADSFYLPVGAESCVTKFANQAWVQGTAAPYAARFQVKLNGAVLYQGTSTAFVGSYVGTGWYQVCGKNKLGNPGPILVNLSIN